MLSIMENYCKELSKIEKEEEELYVKREKIRMKKEKQYKKKLTKEFQEKFLHDPNNPNGLGPLLKSANGIQIKDTKDFKKGTFPFRYDPNDNDSDSDVDMEEVEESIEVLREKDVSENPTDSNRIVSLLSKDKYERKQQLTQTIQLYVLSPVIIPRLLETVRALLVSNMNTSSSPVNLLAFNSFSMYVLYERP